MSLKIALNRYYPKINSTLIFIQISCCVVPSRPRVKKKCLVNEAALAEMAALLVLLDKARDEKIRASRL